MSKEDLKNNGVELGHAFKQFGKTFIRSAKTTAGKVDDWANDKEPQPEEPGSSVYSDGSWRETGKGLGKAFLGMGSAILHTVEDAVDPANSQNPEGTYQNNAQNNADSYSVVDENGNPAGE